MEPNDVTSKDNASQPSFPIVAIGASAGGLNALQCFMAELPKDFGFAIVFMQHLSPTHKSLLPDLLRSARPELEIIEISDGMEVLPGRIYLCPPGKETKILKGSFRVFDLPEDHVHLPIDEFFISLAEETGERVIAVILSGAGTDGARGVQAVRTGGGTVFVQEPSTAEFASMPIAAVNTGQADGVLPAGEIAGEILRLHGTVEVVPEEVFTPEDFDIFYRLVREKTGLRFDHYKKSVVGRRIRRRMYLRGIPAIHDYAKLISEKDSEAVSLASDLMIGVTSFFRDRLAWKALKSSVIRNLAAQDEDSPVRVWTPACATGEEAYSIAMALHYEFSLAGRRRDIQVFATDVNDRALERAREGTYPGSIAADVPSDFMKKYFVCSEDGNSVIITKEVREKVVFAKQDLLADPPFSRLDLVICRNLLIYLEQKAQEKCIALFHYALKDGGYLFMGNAESVGRNKALFRSISHKKCRLYQKLETRLSLRLPLTLPFARERTASPPLLQAPSPELTQSVAGLVQENLLEVYAPAAVAINERYDIIYHNGPTNLYLRHPRGAPTQNLLELIPETLRNRVRGAIYRATHEGRDIPVRANITDDGGRKRQVTLRISKLEESVFLVVLSEKGGITEQAGEVSPEAVVDETAIRQLETELSVTRAELQSNIEQLKSLNEELQSSNEELQAANEELETSREELQSLNEELITVNSQLQGKVEEQEETNNDLNNFLTSTNIPTVFLDTRFRVKRFTPAMSKLLKLIPSDVGRPIADMSQEAVGPDLIADAQAVLDQLVPVKKEMMINQTWYVRSTLPYRTSDNRIEGVVITYNDVTELKLVEERIRHLASFPERNPNPVIEVDSSGKITFCNPATEKILEKLGMDKGDINVFLSEDFDAILKNLENKEEATLYRELTIKDRVFSSTVNVAPLLNVVRIYAFDITERKRAEEAIVRAKEEWERTFSNVPDMIAILDNNHRVIRVNDSMAKRLGRKPEDCVGMKCYEAVHGSTAPPDFCPHSRTLKDGCEHTEEVHEERLGMDLLVTTTPLFDEQGKMVASVHVAHDITGRKKAENKLRESAERLNRAQEIAHLGSWELDLVNNTLAWSDEIYRIFGLQPQEFDATYEAFLARVHPDDRAAVDAAYSGSIREGKDSYETEHRIVRKDNGEVRVVHEKCEHIRDASGNIIRSLGMVHDITEVKQAGEAVKRLATVLQISNDAITIQDFDGNFTAWNDGAGRMFGWTEAEALKMKVRDTIPAEKLTETLEYLEKLRLGETMPSFETQRVTKDGRILDIWLTATVLKDEAGAPVAIATTERDITERKRADEALRQRNEELTRFNSAAVGRELRMIELKKEVNELCGRVGDSPRYPLDFEKEE
ncbi:MAG: PAS domain S-box protein [Nitrospirae bacterium]|nr:PAS domain S-box protein [Nitrospirota bacterium]